jgi:hypothetical protein
LIDVECTEEEFGLCSTLQDCIQKPNEVSGFLKSIKNERIPLCFCSEGDIETFLIIYFKDIVDGLDLGEKVSVRKAIEVLRLKPDIWMLLTNHIPFLVIGVKKPGPGILKNRKVVAQMAQYLNIQRHYFGLTQVYGVLSTLEEFRICWLPDCDNCAASTEQSFPMEQINLSSETSTQLHGTDQIHLEIFYMTFKYIY